MNEIDSLLKSFDSTSDSLEKIKLLISIAKQYRNSDNIKSIEYAEKARELSIESNNKLQEANSLRFISSAKLSMGKYDEVLKMSDEYLKIYKELGDIRGICWSISNIGKCLYRLGNYEDAIKKFYAVLKILEINKEDDIKANVIHSLALLYESLKKYDLAEKKFLELKAIYDNSKEYNTLYPIINNLGNLYVKQEKYSEAKTLFLRAKKLAIKMKKDKFIIGTSVNLASIDIHEKKFNKALKILLDSNDQLTESNSDLWLQGEIFNKIIECYIELKELEKADKFMNISIEIARKSKVHELIITNLITLEKLSILKNDYKKAHKTMKELCILKHKKFIRENLTNLKILEMDLELEKEKKHSKYLELQGNYLKALNDVSEVINKGELEEILQEFISTLGKVANANRTYIFKNHKDKKGRLLFSQISEYVSNGITPEIDNPLLQNSRYDKWLPRWYKTLIDEQIIIGNIKDFPEIEKELLEPQGIKSILIFPIIVNKEFWGFMGFDNCEDERKWENFELEYLKGAVVKIINKIKIQNYIKNLKNENKRFEMTLNAIDSLVYISDIDTHEILFLNKYARKTFGSIVGKKCYIALQGLSKPCDFCTNHLLIDKNGKANSPHIWKFQNTITKEWYQCTDQAIKWSDGRLVRFEIATNISETEKYEQSIKKQDQYFKALIENSNNVVGILDSKGVSKYRSPSYERVIGFKPDEITDNFKHIHPDDRERIQVQFANLLKKFNEIENISYRFIHKNGTMRYIEGTAKNLLKEPSVNGIIISYYDVTDRILAEKALNEKNKLNSLLLNSLPYPSMLINRNREVLAANKIALDVGAIIGDYCWKEFCQSMCLSPQIKELSLMNPDDKDIKCTFCQMDEIYKTKKPYNDPSVEVFDRIWNTFWIPLTDNEYLHYSIDVTEQIENENILKENEEKFRNIFENSPIGIIIFSNTGRIIKNNEVSQKILGSPFPLNTSQDIDFLELHNIKNTSFPKKFRDCLKNKVQIEFEDTFITFCTKQKLHLRYILNPIIDNESKNIISIQCIIEDFSTRIENEKKIKKYSKTQEILFKEVNHRVKNNLSAIIGLINKSNETAKLKGNPIYHDFEELSERIEGLAVVHSLLSQNNWESIKLSNLCKEIIKGRLNDLPPFKKIDLQIKDSNIFIESNQAHQLTLVINELATNSIKYALKDKNHVIISLSFKENKNEIVTLFKDNGVGYPQEMINGEFKNTGLGFEIIRGIISHSLSGKLKIENDNGAKTIITFEKEQKIGEF